jgi:tetratricopeptide (TPR) repeat protein
MNTQQLKLIFRGRLEFGNQRTYEMVTKQWATRTEILYKLDILFTSEQIFDDSDFSLTVPQQTLYSTDKHWRSTTALLKEVAQYAVVGSIKAWCVDNGNLLQDFNIEPCSDKSAVYEYQKGRDLIEEDGKEDEASQALSRAIGKYERHALAYERRGFVNFRLKNYKDAHYDWSKSIDINPNNPEPYYGRGKVRMLRNEWDAAASDFDNAVKKSIALQPIFWRARLNKCECLFHAKKFKELVPDLKMFLQRNFISTDPNFERRRRAWYIYGKSLLELNNLNGAIDAFNQSLAIKEGKEWVTDADSLLLRGICKHKAGKKDYKKDLEAASEMGSVEAAQLLVEWK